MKRFLRWASALSLIAAVGLVLGFTDWTDRDAEAVGTFAEAQIFIEYNSSANDLGFHVFLDAEDWKTLKIMNPNGVTIYEVESGGGFKELGMTELFFEGAEPSLDEFPLDELLALFPEGRYKFVGVTVDGTRLVSRPLLSHAVPEGPDVSAVVRDDDVLIIRWETVDEPADILPDETVDIVAYQVIVEDFQVTLPAGSTRVTVSPEFVESLDDGVHAFEVLAIDASGNKTITEGTFRID